MSHGDTNIDLHTKRSIVDVLTSQTLVLAFGNVFNVVVYVAISWKIIESSHLLLWMVLFFSLLIVRAFANWSVRKRYETFKSEELDTCFRLFLVGAFLSGCFWGVLGYWYTQTSTPIHHAATIFIIAGVTSGAAAIYSVWQPLVRCFLFPALLPLSLSLAISEGSDSIWMALLVLVYLGSLISYSRTYGRKLIKGIQLNLENQQLENRLHVVSHELKNPVASIIGYSELLQKKDWASGDDLKYLNVIRDSAWQVKSMVDLILANADSENEVFSEKTNISKFNRLDLKLELQNLVGPQKSRMERKGLWIETFGFDMVPSDMFLDIRKFRLVLGNLIDNGIKYSSQSLISIVADYDSRSRSLYLNVEDHGIGMGKKSMGRLFEPFFREDRPEVISQEGSGLGLGLSRKIARSMNGDLKVLSSRIGEGSIFEFSMQVETREARLVGRISKDVSGSSQLQELKIVLVEDCIEVGHWFQSSLEKQGAQVQDFENSKDALSYLMRGNAIDILITDISLPGVDGFELAKKYREHGFLGSIFALSFFMEADLRKREGAENFNDFLCKSMSIEDQVLRLQTACAKKKVS